MKKSTFLFFALVLGLFLLPLGSVSAANVQIFRLYNNANGEHLYTSDANEAVTLAGTPIWEDEGTAWYAPDSGSAVYRLYNEGLQNHLYTTDENEVNVLTSQHGWTKERVVLLRWFGSDLPPIQSGTKRSSPLNDRRKRVRRSSTTRMDPGRYGAIRGFTHGR